MKVDAPDRAASAKSSETTQSAQGLAGDETVRVVRIVLTAGILILSLALFSPFVSPLLWAGVLCCAFASC